MNDSLSPIPLYRGATALFRRNIGFLLAIVALELSVDFAIGANPTALHALIFGFVMLWIWIWTAHSGYISLATGERLTAIHLFSRRTHPNLRF